MEDGLRQRNGTGIRIARDGFNETDIEQLLAPKELPPLFKRIVSSATPPEPILSTVKPPMTKKAWLKFLFTHLPIIHWIWTYRCQYLIPDIIAGITIAVMHIPQGLAYALLANLDPVYGLYAAFVPVIIYSIFGTSRHLSIGTFAVISLMVSNAITSVLMDQEKEFCLDISNSSVTLDDSNVTCGDLKGQIAVSLAFLSGLIMVLLGCCGFGFIAVFLSEPLVSGYTTGSAMLVFTSQVSHIFGIKLKLVTLAPSFPDVLKLPLTWVEVFRQVFHWPSYINNAAFVVSTISIVLMIIFKIFNSKLVSKVKCRYFKVSWDDKKCHRTAPFKWTIPIPAPLILMIIGIVTSYLADLHGRFALPVAGPIKSRLPPVSYPRKEHLLVVLPHAFVIAIVSFAVSVSLSKVIAKKYQYIVHPNQEFIAYGLSNIIGSFFSSFNVSASLSRSLVQANAGGKSQVAGLVSCAIVGVVMALLGPVFKPLPLAVLAAIIWVELYGMFKQFTDLYIYFKLCFSDMLLWVVVFLATVLLGVDLSLIVGVGFSFIIMIVRTALPYSAILGHVEGTELFRNMENFANLEKIPGILIFRFLSPLCFISSPTFRTRLEVAAQIERKHWDKEEGGCLKTALSKMKTSLYTRFVNNSEDINELEQLDFHGQSENSSVSQETYVSELETINSQVQPDSQMRNDLHTIIIDCAPIGFMDTVGVRTLINVVMDFNDSHIQVLLASTTKETRDMLQRAGFYETFSKDWLFPSIQDAVNHALCGERLYPGMPRRSPTTEPEPSSKTMARNNRESSPLSTEIRTETLDNHAVSVDCNATKDGGDCGSTT